MVRNSARFLAPIALASVALGVYLVVHGALVKPTAARPPRAAQTATAGGHTRAAHHQRGPAFYVVRPGDTLSAISAKTKVSAARLMALNPKLASAPDSLQTGERLRLRR